MPAAIRPYSIAVAPDSSFTKRETRVFIRWLLQVPHVLSELDPTAIVPVIWIAVNLTTRYCDAVTAARRNQASLRGFRRVVNSAFQRQAICITCPLEPTGFEREH
jgi:hypothetical protein